MAYGIDRESIKELHGENAAFYQKWLQESLAGWLAEPCEGRFAFKGVESVIFGPAARGMEISSVDEGLSYIVDALTAEERAEFEKGLIGAIQNIIDTDRLTERVGFGTATILLKTANLIGAQGDLTLSPLPDRSKVQLNELLRATHATLTVRPSQAPQPFPGA